MKHFLALLFIFSFIGCSTLPSPYKSGKTGCVAGKIRFITSRQFWSLKDGEYNDDIIVTVRNIATKKMYFNNSKNGYYFFYNLPIGDYELIKWRKKIELPGKDMSVYLSGDKITEKFSVSPASFTVLREVTAKVAIPKEFSYKNQVSYIYTDADIEEIKGAFTSNFDKKNQYQDYEWKYGSKSAISIEEKIPANQAINNLVSISDNDYISMEKLYKSGDFYLSFAFFHRILKNLLKAYYIKNVGENVTDTDDLKSLSDASKFEQSPDGAILFIDLTSLNETIKTGSADANFKNIFTKEYFQEYLNRVDQVRDKLKNLLK
ncbi:MAG TPA: hypothetical protein PLG34_05190 [Spirochaetota bacterium]|nr:MAG: hypothetical protein BWX91_01364 [Spirochaetes bacterium ADurb.Bin133]HPY87358.1 hypothetical protein [Spirochaetota bacterium]